MLPHQLLWQLESEICRISDRGSDFQGKVTAQTKSDTGDFAADVVTEADIWTQDHLLQAFLEAGLDICQLVAEEDTPQVARFAPQAEFQLLIDPIDGTRRFVEGLPYFSTIVSLRRGSQSLYTFCYYPKLRWWIRLWEDKQWEVSGRLALGLPQTGPRVVYTSGSPGEEFADWQAEFPEFEWVKGSQMHPCGSKLLYLTGAAAGYASFKPNLYDGTMVYHYAQIREHKILQSQPFDLSHWESDARGWHVRGQYLCLQTGAALC